MLNVYLQAYYLKYRITFYHWRRNWKCNF